MSSVPSVAKFLPAPPLVRAGQTGYLATGRRVAPAPGRARGRPGSHHTRGRSRMTVKRVVPVMAASAILTVAASGLFAQHAASPGGEVTHAIAVLHPTEGSKVKGVIHFTKEG